MKRGTRNSPSFFVPIYKERKKEIILRIIIECG